MRTLPGLSRSDRRAPPSAGAAFALVALLIGGAARAAPPVHVILPTVAVPPGATAVIPITVDQSLASYGITSIGYQLALDPSRITGASFNVASGLIATWGTPFTHATSTVAAALAVGFSPVTSTSTLVQTVYLTVGASVPLGTDIPLAFQSFTLNDGTPAVTLGGGLIQVRGTAGVGDGVALPLALGPAWPNPARGAVRFDVQIPDDGAGARTRIEVLDLAGRRVRRITEEALPAGRYELRWDGRDAAGLAVPAGVYWLGLERGRDRLRERLIVAR